MDIIKKFTLFPETKTESKQISTFEFRQSKGDAADDPEDKKIEKRIKK